MFQKRFFSSVFYYST